MKYRSQAPRADVHDIVEAWIVRQLSRDGFKPFDAVLEADDDDLIARRRITSVRIVTNTSPRETAEIFVDAAEADNTGAFILRTDGAVREDWTTIVTHTDGPGDRRPEDIVEEDIVAQRPGLKRRQRMRKDDVLAWIFDRLDREQEERVAHENSRARQFETLQQILPPLLAFLTKSFPFGPSPIDSSGAITPDAVKDGRRRLAGMASIFVIGLEGDALPMLGEDQRAMINGLAKRAKTRLDDGDYDEDFVDDVVWLFSSFTGRQLGLLTSTDRKTAMEIIDLLIWGMKVPPYAPPGAAERTDPATEPS